MKQYRRASSITTLLPGINVNKFSSKEQIKTWHREARVSDSWHSSIGSNLGDSQCISSFVLTLHSYLIAEGDFKHERQQINNRETLLLLREKFKGKIIVDIGPGIHDSGYSLANLLDCKAYIGVDVFNAKATRASIRARKQNIEKPYEPYSMLSLSLAEEKYYFQDFSLQNFKTNNIPWNVVEEDALVFLKAVPRNSVSIWISGMIYNSIPTERYQKMISEIPRVLGPDNFFLSAFSFASILGLNEEKLEKVIDFREEDYIKKNRNKHQAIGRLFARRK